MANIMPSGKAGLDTRMRIVMNPMSIPKLHRPASVIEAETGSVAIKIMPKANPPSTRCQYQGIANMGFELLPMRLNNKLVKSMPINTPAIIRQEATPVYTINRAPSKQANVEVSPKDPWIVPKND